MVTAVRRFARPVCLIVLLLFAVGPLSVWAATKPAPGAAGVGVVQTSEAGSQPDTIRPRQWGAFAMSPADFASASGLPPVNRSAKWFDANATASTNGGSWWGRRTTAQKTWFIVGVVAGAYGIYALASHSKSHSSGGGGGY